jgi:hypothetical protein
VGPPHNASILRELILWKKLFENNEGIKKKLMSNFNDIEKK